MDLHPYDNTERRYRHTDQDQSDGLKAVALLLHLQKPPAKEALLYDLSFYSGGIGVLDTLAITLPTDSDLWASICEALMVATPEEAAADAAWGEDFLWLVAGEEKQVAPREAAVRFINEERKGFQDECNGESCILFSQWSDVNDWTALWGNDEKLNYAGYSQG